MNGKKTVVRLLATVAIAAAAGFAEAKVTLAEGGRALARIVLAGRDAADKGDFTLTYEGADGVHGKGWPTAYDEQGTMYAVYDFLETECGVGEGENYVQPVVPYSTVKTTDRLARILLE